MLQEAVQSDTGRDFLGNMSQYVNRLVNKC